MVALLLGLVLLTGAQSDDTMIFDADDTRTVDGTGSVGADSTFEFYLLEGSYRHSLTADDGCFVAASVFPARSDLGVPLTDVLQADLSAGTPRPGAEVQPAGDITISEEGWAHIQVGTGTDCRWQYTISGMFLPEGEEPVPPGERNQWWLVIVAAGGVAALAALVWRRRPSTAADDEPVRVLD